MQQNPAFGQPKMSNMSSAHHCTGIKRKRADAAPAGHDSDAGEGRDVCFSPPNFKKRFLQRWQQEQQQVLRVISLPQVQLDTVQAQAGCDTQHDQGMHSQGRLAGLTSPRVVSRKTQIMQRFLQHKAEAPIPALPAQPAGEAAAAGATAKEPGCMHTANHMPVYVLVGVGLQQERHASEAPRQAPAATPAPSLVADSTGSASTAGQHGASSGNSEDSDAPADTDDTGACSCCSSTADSW